MATIPTQVRKQIADQMMIGKGEKKTIKGTYSGGSFALNVACDAKGFYSFVYGVLITSGGAFDLVALIEAELLINNIH